MAFCPLSQIFVQGPISERNGVVFGVNAVHILVFSYESPNNYLLTCSLYTNMSFRNGMSHNNVLIRIYCQYLVVNLSEFPLGIDLLNIKTKRPSMIEAIVHRNFRKIQPIWPRKDESQIIPKMGFFLFLRIMSFTSQYAFVDITEKHQSFIRRPAKRRWVLFLFWKHRQFCVRHKKFYGALFSEMLIKVTRNWIESLVRHWKVES